MWFMADASGEAPERAGCKAGARLLMMLLISLLLGGLPRSFADDWIYTVVPGDNLWDFSARHLDSVTRFKELQLLNNIDSPRNMRPGSSIRVPMAWVPPSLPAPAEVTALTGSARLFRASGVTEDVERGMLLRLGDRLRSDADSSVALLFADQSVLTLHADSELRLDLLNAFGDTGMVDSRLRLSRGRLDTRVKPAVGPGSRFEIHTPSAISAVRGTEYRAAVSEALTATIEVLEGAVAVEAQSEEQLVDAGYGTRVAAGEAPAPARLLLPAPTFQSFPAAGSAPPLELRWSAIEGASRYRSELSDDPDFVTIRWQNVIAQNGLTLPSLPVGSYYFRLRGIDQDGIEGHSSTISLTVGERPPPAAVRASVLNTGSQYLVTWDSDDAVSHYDIEVAGDPSFSAAVDSQTLSEPVLSLAAPRREARYLRIRAVASDGRSGPWGAVYTLKPLPGDPSFLPFVQGVAMAVLFVLLI